MVSVVQVTSKVKSTLLNLNVHLETCIEKVAIQRAGLIASSIPPPGAGNGSSEAKA